MSNQAPPPPPSIDPSANFVQVTVVAADNSLAPIGVDYQTAFKRAFSKYATFTGRASRSEHWKFFLITTGLSLIFLIGTIVGTDSETGESSALAVLFSLAYFVWVIAAFLPSLAVLVRRLHDTDHSGWFYWIALIPIIGAIILLVTLAKKGDVVPNRYGPAA